MSRERARLVIAAVLVLLAAGLGLVAFEIWRWPTHAAAQDRGLARDTVPANTWARTGGVAATLLRATDDAEFRRAVVHFRRGRADDIGTSKTLEQIVSSVEAGIALGAVARSDAPPARRSSALNLQAILVGEVAVFEPNTEARLRVVADRLRRAIRLDPDNDAAKANLELLLRLTGDSDAEGEATGGFGGVGEDASAGTGGGGY